MNAFGIGVGGGGDGMRTGQGDARIILLDMPGYGSASRTEWGREIMKYLKGRRQLRRVFVLVDSMHGLKQKDDDILSLLRAYGISHQVILSKVDKILIGEKGQKKKATGKATTSIANMSAFRSFLLDLKPVVQPEDRSQGPGGLGELVSCSAETVVRPGRLLGISTVRWAILAAAGYDGSVQLDGEAGRSSS